MRLSTTLPIFAALAGTVGAARANPELVSGLDRRPAAAGARDRALRRRYVSAQAYLHALRAEIALGEKDLALAAEELQLALVYDSDSTYLTSLLAEVSLRLGRTDKAGRLADRAIALDARDARSRLVKARTEIAKGRAPLAERSLRAAIECEDAGVEPSIELARLLEKRGRPEEALRVLSQAANRARTSLDPLAEMAAIEARRGHLPAAARALERAIERDPRDLGIVSGLVSIYERQGRYPDAAIAWRRALVSGSRDLESLLQAARAELWIERDDLSKRYVEEISAAHPGPDIEQRLGFLYLSEGRPELALAHLAEAARAGAHEDRVRLARAAGFAQLGREDEALGELEAIGRESDAYVEARSMIVRILVGLGRSERARTVLGAALDRHPRAVPLIILRATLLERDGAVEGALAVLEEARRDRTDDLDLLGEQARILVESGDPARGIDLLRETVESSAGARASEATVRLGEIYALAEDFDAATETMEKLIRAHPESARAMNLLGLLWADRAIRLEDAEKLLRRALAIEPRSGTIIDTLGWALFRLGRLDESERLLSRARRLLPGDSEVEEHLGDVLLARGSSQAAREAYTRSSHALLRSVRANAPGVKRRLSRIREKIARAGGFVERIEP